MLALSYSDGYLEFFGESIDVQLVRVPAAFSLEAEIVAEQIVDATLPLRFRDLLDRRKLLATATTRPLLPTTLARAVATRDLVAALNSASASEREEVIEWT